MKTGRDEGNEKSRRGRKKETRYCHKRIITEKLPRRAFEGAGNRRELLVKQWKKGDGRRGGGGGRSIAAVIFIKGKDVRKNFNQPRKGGMFQKK